MSVDADTKHALRALADADFGGNLSALVTDFASEARRRLAAGLLLRARGVPKLSAAEARALQAEIDAEGKASRVAKKRAKKARAA